MKITHAIIRNGISRGILEVTKVPEKKPIFTCAAFIGNCCTVHAVCRCYSAQNDYNRAIQAIWDASPEFEDQDLAEGYAIKANAKDYPFKDGIYPLKGVNAERVWKYRFKASNGMAASEWFDVKPEMKVWSQTNLEYLEILRLIPQPNSEQKKQWPESQRPAPPEVEKAVEYALKKSAKVDVTEVSEPTARQITYAFLELPYHRKVEIAISLNVYDKADYHLPETEKWKLVFGRIKEAGRTKELWDKVKLEVVGVDEKKEPETAGLLPCPFCGDKPEWIKESLADSHFHLRCANGECHVTISADRRDKAIGFWNRRGVSEGEPNQEKLWLELSEKVFHYEKLNLEKAMKYYHIQKLNL